MSVHGAEEQSIMRGSLELLRTERGLVSEPLDPGYREPAEWLGSPGGRFCGLRSPGGFNGCSAGTEFRTRRVPTRTDDIGVPVDSYDSRRASVRRFSRFGYPLEGFCINRETGRKLIPRWSWRWRSIGRTSRQAVVVPGFPVSTLAGHKTVTGLYLRGEFLCTGSRSSRRSRSWRRRRIRLFGGRGGGGW